MTEMSNIKKQRKSKTDLQTDTEGLHKVLHITNKQNLILQYQDDFILQSVRVRPESNIHV